MKWFRNIHSGAVEAWADDSARAQILADGEGPNNDERASHEELTVGADSLGGSMPAVSVCASVRE